MKNTTSILSILLILLLVACQDEAPETAEAPEPTLAAADMPKEGASPGESEETEGPEPTEVPTPVLTEETSTNPTAEPFEVDTEAEQSAGEGPTEVDEGAGSSTSSSLDEQTAQLAAINPPPQLSDRDPHYPLCS